MQIPGQNYYDTSKFSNTFIISTVALETFFINNIFRSDGTRVLYASEAFAFRRRLELLSKAGGNNVFQLQFPFMTYWRDNNYSIDDRPAVQSATAALTGYADESLGGQVLRFLQVKTQFTCVLWMNSDLDAQMAHEQLLWMQNPSAKQWTMPGAITYNGVSLDMPIILSIENIQFNPNYTEVEWLKRNRVLPIKFNVTIRTVAMSQLPQTPDSTTQWDIGPPTITEKVFLDFLSYKGDVSPTTINITDEVIAYFDPNADVAGSISVQSADQTSLTVTWYYNPMTETLLLDDVTITLNGGAISVSVPKDLKTYTFTDLAPESTYQVAIFFYTVDGKVNKYTTTGVTDVNSIPTIKPIVGY